MPSCLPSLSAPCSPRWRSSQVALGSLLTGLLTGCISVTEPPPPPAPVTQVAPNRPAPAPANRSAQATQGGGQLKVVYSEVRKPFYRGLEQVYQQTQVFEKLGDVIDQRVKLPRDVPIVMAECGFENAFYEPAKHRIVLCYELTDYFIKLFKRNGLSDREAGQQALYATVFTLFHETGHMLTGELDLPITGREEDAADQFSTLILAQNAGEAGKRAVEAAATWFGLSSGPTNRTRFMDEHSLDQQRFYAIMCLLYGNDPQRYEATVQKLGFPESRRQRCQIDYAKTSKAWKSLLAPHMKAGSNF